MEISRRAFVGLCAGAAGTLAFGGTARAFGGNGSLVRPPVVLDEADFTSRCVRCYRCVSICPTGAIEPARLEDGILEVKTPKMNFHRGLCDFCNKCVDVCPTAAITACDPYNPASGRMGIAMVDPERCLAFYNGCDVCIGACPFDAITANEFGQPEVDESKCNGCGACVNACPALVYRSYSGSDTRGIEVVPETATKGGAA